jgi:hypothetical protein
MIILRTESPTNCVSVNGGGKDFSFPSVQTVSPIHPASRSVGYTCCFPGDKADGAWSWSLTSAQGQLCYYMTGWLSVIHVCDSKIVTNFPDKDRSRDSAVGIATGHRLDDRLVGDRVPVRARFSPLHVVLTGSGPTQPLIKWVPGTLPPGVKRPGHEADHSPPTRAKVNNTWIYASFPPLRLHGVALN